MLVDRYKYLDLFPCTPLELKIMGYVVSDKTTKISSDYYSVSQGLGTTEFTNLIGGNQY